MDLLTIILIAVGLSFDTFAVSVSSGIALISIRFLQACRIAIVLAVFQGLMPFIGWLLGKQVVNLIRNYDHWIAFGLLALLGIKLIYESFEDSEDGKKFNPLKITILIGMAIATSIDALVVGISFAFIDEVNIYLAVFIIGVTTYLASMVGILIGKKVGNKLGRKMEIIGGLILISIGAKILIEHLMG